MELSSSTPVNQHSNEQINKQHLKEAPKSGQSSHEEREEDKVGTNVETNVDKDMKASAYDAQRASASDHLINEMIEEDQASLIDSHGGTITCMTEPTQLSIDMTSLFITDTVFDRHEDVTKYLKELARTNGVVLIKKGSDFSGKRTPFILYQCEREGAQKDHYKGGIYERKEGGVGKNKARASSTKKCGCPFRIKTIQDRVKGVWSVHVLNGIHNHVTVKYDEGHAYLGRLEKDQIDEVRRMTENGILPKHILRELRSKDKRNCTSPKTVYNIRSKIKKQAREGRTVMQQLYKLADESKSFVHCRQTDDVVTYIFWAHTHSLSLARCFPSVMLMDSTYKTNKYKMPLLQIVGVTSTDMSFSIGFALLSEEKKDTYTWALNILRQAIGDQSESTCCIVTDREEALMNSVRVVFPKAKNILCKWHIQKCLVANLKKKDTTTEEWNNIMNLWSIVVQSTTEKEYNDRLKECEEAFGERGMSYIKSTWLDLYKELFVSAWTDSVFHLGNTSTSRVEGMHAVFKNWLSNSLGDLVTGWEAGVKMVEQEIKNIKKSFELSLFMDPKLFRDEPMLKELRHHVSIYALELLVKELKKEDGEGDLKMDCGCYIRKTHGLPCTHELARFKKKPGFIPLSSVDVHWKTLDIEGPPPNDSALDHVPVLNALTEKIVTATPWEKHRLLMKIREICQPVTTSVDEPKTNLTCRGRPKGAKNKRKTVEDISTKRDLSLHEHIEEELIRCMEVTKPLAKKKKGSVSTRTRSKSGNKASDLSWYMEHVPVSVRSHVSDIVDVEMDGNCGFRVIAYAMGFQQSNWTRVRNEVKDEMVLNKDHYMALFKGVGYVYDKCLTSIDHQQGACGEEKYFQSFLGWVICNVYDCVLSILSHKNGNQTFLPSLKKPLAWPPKHIWMVQCHGIHFVNVEMKDSCPVPKVPRVWHDVRLAEASSWHDKLRHRLGLWVESSLCPDDSTKDNPILLY